MLCGSSRVEASSGQQTRYRLNRGGDRQANAALHRIVMVRLRWDQRSKGYLERRTKEGMSKREIIRCLKRYVAREKLRRHQGHASKRRDRRLGSGRRDEPASWALTSVGGSSPTGCSSRADGWSERSSRWSASLRERRLGSARP